MTWRIGIASGACMDCSILDIIPALGRSGTTGVEIGTPPGHFNPWRDEDVQAVGVKLAESKLEAISIHAPFGRTLDLADPNPHHRHAAAGAIVTAARAIKRLGGRLVVVHPSDLDRHGQDVDARLADCVRGLTPLAQECRQEGLVLVIESPLPHLIGGHPDEFAWILKHVDGSARVCLDVGHTTLGRHWTQFVNLANGRIVHIHASDHHGRFDDHLVPGDGTINWAEIRGSLEASGFDGWVMLELAHRNGDPAALFERAFDRASRLLAPKPA